MFLNPYEPLDEVEYDYAIIDPNLNSDYFHEIKDKLISLAPEYAMKVESSFPYLLRFSSVEKKIMNEINDYDLEQINRALTPFLIFKFKSKPTREPDIVKHLKNSLIYELKGKKYLYRFFDPKIWILLNYFKSPDFIKLNEFFEKIQIGFFDRFFYFDNIYKKILDKNDVFIKYELLDNIGINNRVLGLIQYNFYDLENYFNKVIEIFKYINLLNGKKIINKSDKVAILYHMLLLGSDYIETEFFHKLYVSEKGYEQASKQISTVQWNDFFKKNNIRDEILKNKVMYDY